MKKLLSLLCLTASLCLFTGVASAKSFCPSYFDTNKSFAENIQITSDTQWVLFKEMPYDLNNTRSSYTLNSLGYYSNSGADSNLEFDIRVDRKDFSVNESSYYSWIKSQTITKDSTLDLLVFDTNINQGSYERFKLQDLISQATVYQIRSSYAYRPESSENNIRYNANSTSPSPTSLTTHYIFGLDFGYNGTTYTYLFKLSEYAPYGPPQVPVPGAIWLMGTGIAALGVMRRKHKTA